MEFLQGPDGRNDGQRNDAAGYDGIRNEYVRLSYVPVETMNEGAEPPHSFNFYEKSIFYNIFLIFGAFAHADKAFSQPNQHEWRGKLHTAITVLCRDGMEQGNL